MSTVHRAYDTVLHRPVAIKLLRPLAGDSAVITREQREIRMSAALNHHGLVTLYEADAAVLDDVLTTFLVMELVDGPSLAARIRQGAVGASEVLEWVRDLLEALLVIHNSGVIHRDIKPGNILLAPSLLPGRNYAAKLTDFGIATLSGAAQITSTGTIVGTAAYLSPEQALGRTVGPPSDIYSLGLVILELLTGSPPFTGTMVETLSARLHRDPDVPASLGPLWCSVLTEMTQRDPESRPTALELFGRLAQSSSESSVTATVPTPVNRVTAEMPTVAFSDATPPLSRNRMPGGSRRRRAGAIVLGSIAGLAIAGSIVFFSVAADQSATRLPVPAPTNSASASPTPSPVGSVSFVPLPPVPAPTVTHSDKSQTDGNHHGDGHNSGNGNTNKK